LQHPAPGKLYITVLQRRSNASQIHDATYRHIIVDPWELTCEPPEADMIIKELCI
jgi:hypothetical protein